ncbi:hypothetical protein AAFF_G00202920 [Aldrovandia affinis]|uniref:Uncharacterized protein n=1 Tax=Aldrovandia affinis TaxID=143900 RepID=A0AAD7SX38_9TELE|nr:hypothetical protein AAFF_G00202920 [Aldrovandia affinis]
MRERFAAGVELIVSPLTVLVNYSPGLFRRNELREIDLEDDPESVEPERDVAALSYGSCFGPQASGI